MGSTSNKSTRKYSKRHLKKAIEQRKKTKFVNNQRVEKDAKLQRAVRRTTERSRDLNERKTSEQEARLEKENFLKKPDISEDELDLKEITDSEGGESRDGVQFGGLALGEELDGSPSGGKISSNAVTLSHSSEEDVEDRDVELEISKYKKQLSDLKEQDPEFYRYLQDADQQLLQFQPSSGEEDILEYAASPDVNEGVLELSLEEVEGWCEAVLKEKPSLESLRFLMTAYSFACQYGEKAENEVDEIQSLLQFSSSSVYSKEGDGIFRTFLGFQHKKRVEKNDVIKATKKQPEVAAQLHRFFASSCRLLRQSLEPNVLAFVLRQIRSSAVLLEGTPAKMTKLFLRAALEIFSSATPAPRLQSVLLLREIVLHHGENTVRLCLKGVYKSFLSACDVVDKETLPQVYFMGTCVIELYSLSPETAYQNAFKFIKDLAVDLREGIIAKDKEVFNWRFVHGLELWARLIGCLFDKGDLRQLLYPVAQLLTGASRCQDQMRYLPMRLRLISAANRLSEATGVFIPVASLLIGILTWSHLQSKPMITGKEKCPNMALCLSVDDATLKNSVFQSEVVEQVLELLAQHLAPFSHAISFPEMSHWITIQLKKFAKGVQFPSYKSGAMQLVTAMKESAEKVLSRRMRVTFSPRDIARVEQFHAEGKAMGKSPLELLSDRLAERRKQRQSLHTTEVVTLHEPIPEPAKKQKSKPEMTLSDAESLTSDEGELVEAELEGLTAEPPSTKDILEEYVLSEDEEEEDSTPAKKRRRLEAEGEVLPKQKRRKEKRKANRKKTPT